MANIRTARRSGLVLRGGTNRRATTWIPLEAGRAVMGGAQTAILVAALSAGALALRPFTIVRTRGFWHVRSDQVAATEVYGCSLGKCVVSDQAVAIGVTAVPTPDTDMGSELWFVHESMYSEIFVGAAPSQIGDNGLSSQYDSRAMRKVEEGQDVITVMETGTALASVSAIVTNVDRLLVKLH